VLGAKRRDERAMVGWQAVTCATTGALVGAVIGIAGGRVAWAAVASSTGVVEEHVIPWAGIVGVVLATVLAALAVALGVIVAGRHARPADGLRTE
jgi:ABC-type antimicrobial peptide transport system permease subunit